MTRYDFDSVYDRRATGSSKWTRYGADVLPMWVADMDFAAPPEVVAAIRQRLEHPILGYTAPSAALREQIVADMAAKYGWRIAADDICFLPGVVPGFNAALRALLAPGDGVVVNPPVYPPILAAPGQGGYERIDVPLTAAGDHHHLALDALAAGLDRARAYLLCNPHNPVGKVFSREELTAVAEACVARDVVIVSDEIHCDIVLDGRRHIPIASLAPEVARRTITLMAASKTYNIAGLSTAFAIIPDPALRKRFDASRHGLVEGANLLGMTATLAAFRDGGPWLAELLSRLAANRDRLVRRVAERMPGIRLIAPQSTHLAWLDCGGLGLDRPAQAFFLERGKVAFNAGSDFGADYADFVRLNFGCPTALLDDGLDRMERALATR
jgi:cystathionine beta-lyase